MRVARSRASQLMLGCLLIFLQAGMAGCAGLDRFNKPPRGSIENSDKMNTPAAESNILLVHSQNLSPEHQSFIQTHANHAYAGRVIEANAISSVLSEIAPESNTEALGAIILSLYHAEFILWSRLTETKRKEISRLNTPFRGFGVKLKPVRTADEVRETLKLISPMQEESAALLAFYEQGAYEKLLTADGSRRSLLLAVARIAPYVFHRTNSQHLLLHNVSEHPISNNSGRRLVATVALVGLYDGQIRQISERHVVQMNPSFQPHSLESAMLADIYRERAIDSRQRARRSNDKQPQETTAVENQTRVSGVQGLAQSP